MLLTKIPEYGMAINLANVDCVIIESEFQPEALPTAPPLCRHPA